MFNITFLFLASLVGVAWGQQVIYNVRTQAECKDITRGPTRDCRWVGGLDMVDQTIEGGRIVAYKIRWFSGQWQSNWFVPGVNNLSGVYNPYSRRCRVPYRANNMRRTWAMFYDHTHRFIICKPKY